MVSRPFIQPVGSEDAYAQLRRCATWIFDLDNTLYPCTIGLFRQMDERMRSYIAAFLGMEEDAAFALQKDYFHTYGTSLRGLMNHHQMDPAPFLADVHDIDLSLLEADAVLEQALRQLSGRKLIFTNATTRHAERVLDRLGIGHHFTGIFDIVAADYRPKPTLAAYHALIDQFGIDPRDAVMVEDMALNLRPAAELGMTTVWVRTQSEHGQLGSDGDHIHHVADDLRNWLQAVTAVPDPSGQDTADGSVD